MSLGSGSSSSSPKLKTIDIGAAQDAALGADIQGYNLSDTAYAAPGSYTAPLVTGRGSMIDSLLGESTGGISSQATGALDTAGLEDLATSIPGKNEFQTSRNLGQPILAKEQRDRNFASNLLLQNPQRLFGLSGQDVVHIALANTGNVNALNEAVAGTQANAYSSSVVQGAQNFAGLSSLISGFAKNYASSGNIFSPYTNPTSIYNPYNSPTFYQPTPEEFGAFGGGA